MWSAFAAELGLPVKVVKTAAKNHNLPGAIHEGRHDYALLRLQPSGDAADDGHEHDRGVRVRALPDRVPS